MHIIFVCINLHLPVMKYLWEITLNLFRPEIINWLITYRAYRTTRIFVSIIFFLFTPFFLILNTYLVGDGKLN